MLKNKEVNVSSGRGAKRIKSGKLEIFNTHTQKNGSIITIYNKGVLIATESVPKRGGYKYLQTLNKSKHFVSLERQLMPHCITLREIGL